MPFAPSRVASPVLLEPSRCGPPLTTDALIVEQRASSSACPRRRGSDAFVMPAAVYPTASCLGFFLSSWRLLV